MSRLVLRRVLSGDMPRSRPLSILIGLLALLLIFAPLLFPGAKALDTAAKILIFIVLVASFDLLLGYAGIVSFAHTMFFGIGAYGVAIACSRWGPYWYSIAAGGLLALLVSSVLALFIGLFSLRVRAIFFAMITLAVATAFQTLASQLSWLTGGEDGITFKVPASLYASARHAEFPTLGFVLDGRVVSYYVLLLASFTLFLLLLRLTNSPFGRVLQAIRENDFRASAIGYRVVLYRTAANVIAALFACLAGVLMAFWLRFNGPETTLSPEVMLDTLLIVVIGGMGTMYGAAIGATLFLFAQGYLQDILQFASGRLTWAPALAAILSPERWLIWLGLLFVLSIYYFPEGVVGRLRAASAASKSKATRA